MTRTYTKLHLFVPIYIIFDALSEKWRDTKHPFFNIHRDYTIHRIYTTLKLNIVTDLFC